MRIMPRLSIKYILGGIIIYAELLIVGLRDYICSEVIDKWYTFGIIAERVAACPWLIVVTSVILAIPYYYIIEHVYRHKRFSLLRFAFFTTTALMFFSLNGVALTGGFALSIALGCCFVGLCVLEVIKSLWNNDGQVTLIQENKEPIAKGFSNITKDDDLYDLGWESYAKGLYDKLVATNVEEAYAVGLNAKWGYGKTTFLNEIKKNLTGDEILMDFNPWLSSCPDQIVKDFFENLKEKLLEYDNQINDDIDNYVKLLINMDVHPLITSVAKLWEGVSSTSIADSRDNIQTRINRIGKKIIVVIDDLDRLEKDEIYEVLKLIRNTAKFKNLIYIVAYDRYYICTTLKEKGIVAPETYLYKIFQMEVLLPTFEGDLIEKMLMDELKKQLDGEVQLNFLKAIENEVSKANHTKRAIGFFLKNFRDVKRFANLLCLEIEQVATVKLVHDVLPWGLFWLEIIHYAYEDVYLKLRENYTELLAENGFDGKLTLKDGKNDNGILDEHLFEVLKYMFGPSTDCRGINNINSYSTYFSLRPYIDQVGWSDFIYSVNTNDDQVVEQKMKEWLDSPEGKEASLYSRFKGIKIGKSTRFSKAFVHYFKALEFWADYKNNSVCKYYLPKIYHHIVDKRNCNDGMISHVCDFFDKTINHLLEKRENCVLLMDILTEVYPMDFGEEYLINDNVIGEEKIKEYVVMAFNKFIEGREIKVEDLCDDKSEIHRLIKSAKIDMTEDFGGAPFFVFDFLLRDYFKNKPVKDSAAVLMNTFRLNGDMIDRGYEEDELRHDLSNRISKYFVSLIWYRNFLWQCVAEERTVVDKYMKDNLLA